MGDMDFLSSTEFTIPIGQIIFYMIFSTFCFFLRKYKLGLMISFAFVFNWGFLHASANFVDEMGEPTLGLFLYLGSGFTLAVLVLMGFMRKEADESPSASVPSTDPTTGTGQELGICPTCHQGVGMISNSGIP